MRFALMVVIGVFGFAVTARADGGYQAAVEMPVSVRIIDYQTTRRICGSSNAPSWCPVHLLTSGLEATGESDNIKLMNARQRIKALENAELLNRRKAREVNAQSRDNSNTKM